MQGVHDVSSSAPWIRALRSHRHQSEMRAIVLAESPICAHCWRRPSFILDHQPPLALFSCFEDWVAAGGHYVASCLPCSQAQSSEVRQQVAQQRRAVRPTRQW